MESTVPTHERRENELVATHDRHAEPGGKRWARESQDSSVTEFESVPIPGMQISTRSPALR